MDLFIVWTTEKGKVMHNPVPFETFDGAINYANEVLDWYCRQYGNVQEYWSSSMDEHSLKQHPYVEDCNLYETKGRGDFAINIVFSPTLD